MWMMINLSASVCELNHLYSIGYFQGSCLHSFDYIGSSSLSTYGKYL